MSKPSSRRAAPKAAPAAAPALGLVCQTSSEEVRFRTITRTRLLQLGDGGLAALRALYRDNAGRLGRALAFCAAEGLRLYRMPSSLFPFADGGPGESLLEELAPELARLGAQAAAQGLRLVMHPDQYVVLNSESPGVVDNARRILAAHGRLLDLLGQPRSPWAAVNIHGGKGGRPVELVRAIVALPEPVRARLTLENDERVYGSEVIHAICREAGVPMVFDAHHHLVHAALDSYDDPSVGAWLEAAARTWPDRSWQLVHISNGREHLRDPRHSDFITRMPASYARAPWIEIEAKAKEEAVRRLRTAA